MAKLRNFVKVTGTVLGVTAIAVVVKNLLTTNKNDFYDDFECGGEEDMKDTLSACDEAYDRGYLHGLHGLPYAGKNEVALAFQDIATAKMMAEYGKIVQENLQADVIEPYIADDPNNLGNCGRISDVFGNHEDHGDAYNEASRAGCALE